MSTYPHRLSLRLDDETLKAIDARTPSGGSRAETVRRIVGRYADIIDRSTKDLTRHELEVVSEVLRGQETSHLAILWLANVVLSATGDEDLGGGIKAMDYAQRAALIDAIERRWAAGSPDPKASVSSTEGSGS